MNDGTALLSPTFPPHPPPVNPGGGFGGFETRLRKGIIRKTVDYQSSAIRFLENRIWQRDGRDCPLLQPDPSYFNELMLPSGMLDQSVNSVTTKFVRASTNKQRSPIFCTSWVPDGRRLLTGAASGEFTLWNGVNFNYESILQAHDVPIRSMRWSHNGEWMVSTDDRGFVKYWQSNFNNVHTFQAHSEPIRCSSFSPNDSKLATCSDDGTVRIFDFIRCSEEFLLRGHGADVKCCDWHPWKSLLVTGSKDNQQPVKLWDPRAGQSISTIHAHKNTVQAVSWNKNGNWLITAARDYLIKIFDIRAMKEMSVLKGHKKEVNTVAWHPIHESLFASGGSDGAILFWLVGSERELGGMESAHDGFIWSLSWHPVGHILCSGSNDHTSKFWSRNRPGEELKDKYNTNMNPFGIDDMDSNSFAFPGMGIDMRKSSAAITLPPPSSHQTDAVTLPSPQWQARGPAFKQPHSMDPSLAEQGHASRVDVPVLGADIIKETFQDNPQGVGPPGEGDQQQHFHPGDHPPPPPLHPPHGPPPHNGPGPHRDMREEFPPGHFNQPPPHGPPRLPSHNRPPPEFMGEPRMGNRPPPPGFRPEPGDPRMREWGPRDPFGHPGPRGEFSRFPQDEFEDRGHPMNNRFNWHHPNYPRRRPSFDEEWGGPPDAGGNPYSYRRPMPPPHHPPQEEFRESRDPRMMDPHHRMMDHPEEIPHGHGPPPPSQRRPSDDFHGRVHERFDNRPAPFGQPPQERSGPFHEGGPPANSRPPEQRPPFPLQEQGPQHPRDPRRSATNHPSPAHPPPMHRGPDEPQEHNGHNFPPHQDQQSQPQHQDKFPPGASSHPPPPHSQDQFFHPPHQPHPPSGPPHHPPPPSHPHHPQQFSGPHEHRPPQFHSQEHPGGPPPRRDFHDQPPPDSRYPNGPPRAPPEQMHSGDPRLRRGQPPNEQGYPHQAPPANKQGFPPDHLQQQKQYESHPPHPGPGARNPYYPPDDSGRGPPPSHPPIPYDRHFPDHGYHGDQGGPEPPRGDPRYDRWGGAGPPPGPPGRGHPYPDQRWGGRRDWNHREQHTDPRDRKDRDSGDSDKKDRDDRDRERRKEGSGNSRSKGREKENSKRSADDHRGSNSRRKGDTDRESPPVKKMKKDGGEERREKTSSSKSSKSKKK